MNLYRKRFSFFGLAAFTLMGLTFSGCASNQPDKGERLNIIYIMTDDHSEQTISAFNNKFAYTPNIDRLANEGVRFTQSFVTNSICGPSRACLLTGKHSHKNGKINNEDYFDGAQQTIPKLLQKGGYETAMIGKWHLESTPTGFDHWDILPGQGDYYNPDFITPNGVIQRTGYVTDIITQLGIEWIEHRDKSKPFALYLHHKAPHRNWMPKLEDIDAYEDSIFALPSNFYDTYENRLAASTAEMKIGSDHDMDLLYDLKVYDGSQDSRLLSWYNVGDSLGAYGRMTAEEKEVWNAFYADILKEFNSKKRTEAELAAWKYQRYMKDYLKTAKAVDDNMGVLLTYLEEHNLLENTLIIYTSDQGFYMGEHGWFDKRFMYEESLRTPLVARIPKNLSTYHGDLDIMVQNIDHGPTFLEIAGVDIPADIQGASYLSSLKGEKSENWREGVYYHYQEYPAEHMVKRHYGIRGDRYKLIHFYFDIDEWELYDLEKDPNEMNNLIANNAYQNVVDSMKTELRKLQVKYDDPIRKTIK